MMTDFQTRIRRYLLTLTERNHGSSTWEIAQRVFPEKWARRAAHGILIAHVRRACDGMPCAVWIPSPDQHGCGKISLHIPAAGYLTDDQAARYWHLLLRHCVGAAGSASLGCAAYQHLGFSIGPGAVSPTTVEWVTRYAAAEVPGDKTAASLFRALVNTHRVRFVGRPEAGRAYVELWSAYRDVTREQFDADRANLILLLEHRDT